jgi:hypothetical protein
VHRHDIVYRPHRLYLDYVTPVFPMKTRSISYVCQDQNFTHMNECNITRRCLKHT